VVHAKEFVMKSMTVGRHVPGVLVVDDEPLVRSFLRDALGARARVVEAADREHAIAILQGHTRGTLDLLLVDYLLPTGSGLDILALTKRRWPWLPVVILTGFGTEDLAVQALRGGASDYLRKPVSVDMLLKTVDTLTAQSPGAPAAAAPVGADDGHPRLVHPNIQKALVFMREHFAEPVTLSEVARQAGLSRFHFCRLFHHETGVPFHDYLHDLRVTQAKTLLTDRYLTVTEVAYAVGFNDLSHFDRTFRRMIGRSPSEYRKSMLYDGRPRPVPLRASPDRPGAQAR
jgi:YesN/AraC family two-component response regulator